MRATRRNMDLAAKHSSFQLVLISDDDQVEYSADSHDYWQHDLDADLGGELMCKRTVWFAPERCAELSNLLATFDEGDGVGEAITYTCHS